ncbi:hypothetical protein [Lysobacter sp. A421]
MLRYTKVMAEKACHGFGSTTQVGLTQALGCPGDNAVAFRKTWVGVVVLVTTYFVGSATLGAFNAVAALGMGTQAALVWLVSASVASCVVRRGFWLPTAVVWLVMWALAVGLLHAMAGPTGQTSWVGILRYNWLGLALSAVTAMVGASVGKWWPVATSKLAT